MNAPPMVVFVFASTLSKKTTSEIVVDNTLNCIYCLNEEEIREQSNRTRKKSVNKMLN